MRWPQRRGLGSTTSRRRSARATPSGTTLPPRSIGFKPVPRNGQKTPFFCFSQGDDTKKILKAILVWTRALTDCDLLIVIIVECRIYDWKKGCRWILVILLVIHFGQHGSTDMLSALQLLGDVSNSFLCPTLLAHLTHQLLMCNKALCRLAARRPTAFTRDHIPLFLRSNSGVQSRFTNMLLRSRYIGGMLQFFASSIEPTCRLLLNARSYGVFRFEGATLDLGGNRRQILPSSMVEEVRLNGVESWEREQTSAFYETSDEGSGRSSGSGRYGGISMRLWGSSASCALAREATRWCQRFSLLRTAPSVFYDMASSTTYIANLEASGACHFRYCLLQPPVEALRNTVIPRASLSVSRQDLIDEVQRRLKSESSASLNRSCLRPASSAKKSQGMSTKSLTVAGTRGCVEKGLGGQTAVRGLRTCSAAPTSSAALIRASSLGAPVAP